MHRLCVMVIALPVGVISNAFAQPATAGIVSSPCPLPDPAAEARLKPIDDLCCRADPRTQREWCAL